MDGLALHWVLDAVRLTEAGVQLRLHPRGTAHSAEVAVLSPRWSRDGNSW
ncbi:hypothetical protein [Streptomyces sp. NPDC007172]